MRPDVDLEFLKIKNSSFEESFQNLILRPVIKVQTALLIEAFKKYADSHKGIFYQLRPEKKAIYIDNSIKKDQKFRNFLKGIIIGMFTIEEYEDYKKSSSSLNKRMMNLVSKRLSDNLQLLERSSENLTDFQE
tara:strand:+ start:330 stop:728 length:399 start_codon:yes stop_codon:yes gene_type:complete